MNRYARRLGMLAACTVLCTAISIGAPAEDLADLLACRTIHDPSARLACYDRAAATLRVPPPPASRTPAPRSPPLDPKKTFGLPEGVVAEREVAAGTRAREVHDLHAHLVGLSRTADGRILFRLDNGQTWRELQPQGDLLAKVGDAVVISRGWLGSYWLKLPSGRNCKVDRVD